MYRLPVNALHQAHLNLSSSFSTVDLKRRERTNRCYITTGRLENGNGRRLTLHTPHC
jgi:hypothetical protein